MLFSWRKKRINTHISLSYTITELTTEEKKKKRMCADHVNDVRVGGVHQYAPAGRHILHQFVESGPLHLFTLQISDRVEEVKQDAALLELLHKQLLLLCRRSIWNTNTTQTRSYARHISHLGNKKDDAIIKQRFPTTAMKLQCLPPGRRWSYRSTTKTIRTSPITTASTRHHHVNRLRLKCITCSLQCLWTICNWICFLYLSSSLFFFSPVPNVIPDPRSSVKSVLWWCRQHAS